MGEEHRTTALLYFFTFESITALSYVFNLDRVQASIIYNYPWMLVQMFKQQADILSDRVAYL